MTEEIKSTSIKHPFTSKSVVKYHNEGDTIADILADCGIDTDRTPVFVSVDGNIIEPDYWSQIRPKPGTNITIRSIPTGGGGNDKVVRSVLSIAVLAAAPYAGTMMADFAASGQFISVSTYKGIAAVSRAVMGAVGLAAVNALVPPQQQSRNRGGESQRDSITNNITGSQNRANRYGVLPKVYGKTKVFPPYAAEPVTEGEGKDNYLRMMFAVGYGPLDISDIKIGETPIAEYDNVELEIREGYDDDAPRELYTDDIEQENLSITLSNSASPITRTSTEDRDELSVDMTFNRGLVEFTGGKGQKNRSVTLRGEYKKTEDSTWEVIPDMKRTVDLDYTGIFGYEITSGKKIATNPAAGSTHSLTDLSIIDNSDELLFRRIYYDSSGTQVSEIIKLERGVDYTVDNTTASVTLDSNLYSNLGKPSPGGSGYNENKYILYAGFTDIGRDKITNNTTSAFSVNYRWSLPETGQYDVRFYRETADTDDSDIFDTVTWSALRGIKSDAELLDFPVNVATIALRIKATDQLNGVIDRLNCIAHSVLPDYDAESDTWIEQKTNNNASVYRDMLLGPASGEDLEKADVDMEEIEEFHTYCENNDFTFNGTFEDSDTLWQCASDVLRSARGSRNVRDGLFSLIYEEKKDVPIQHFTPRNSRNFSGQRNFPDIPDALKIGFLNEEKGYNEDERIIYQDGEGPETATNFEKINFFGVTDPEQIYTLGRYHLANMKLRPETYTFTTDVEHIVCTRGDLINVTHDVPQWGLTSGRVRNVHKDANGNLLGVSVDAEIDMDGGNEYTMRFRIPQPEVGSEDTFITRDLVTDTSVEHTVEFQEPISYDDYQPDVGSLFGFGYIGEESVELLVKAIRPKRNLEAEIECVDYAPEVLAADEGPIPDFDSQMSLRGQFQAPAIKQVRSGFAVALGDNQGNYTNRIMMEFENDFDLNEADQLEIQKKPSASGEWEEAGIFQLPVTNPEFEITPVEAGQTYDLRARKTSELGVSSQWSQTTHTIEGKVGPPSDVENLDLDVVNGTGYLSWTAIEDADLAHYTVRHSPSTTDAKWEDSDVIVDQVARSSTSVSVPAMTGTYMVKAVDIDNYESKNAALAITDIAELADLNVVETATESPNYNGTKTNLVELDPTLDGSGGELTLNGSDQIKDWDSLAEIASLAYGKNGLHTSGTYEFVQSFDLGSVYDCRLSSDVEVRGENVGNILKLWDQLSDIQQIGGADPSDYDVTVQVRSTKDDPSGSPTWSDWGDLTTGEYSARGFEFRCLLSSSQKNIRPKVTKLEVTVDMPDRQEAGGDIVTDASGEIITFENEFYKLEGISVTIDNAESGDYTAVTNKTTTGFEIQILDDTDTGVSRQIDYLAKGYGVVS